jgi:beta-glucosidase
MPEQLGPTYKRVERYDRGLRVTVSLRPLTFAIALAVAVSLTLQAQPANAPRTLALEQRITALLARMTLEEKFGQLQQLDGEAGGAYRPEHVELARKGLLGSTLNVRGAARVNELQRVAVDESRLKIPLIFAFDVIHGYRTIFPIPLGESASWDPAAVERSAAIAAAEARAAGVAWTFAPMVDIARDARWGRIAEGAGEDPFLGAALARARVLGFQGRDYSAPDRVVACAKHWVAYGVAESGRDYNTTDVSERTLRTVYFPPFKAAHDAGVGSFMSAFNDLNGVPASANAWTLGDVLRREWRFDGLVVSDYNSVLELVNHGIAADAAGAARAALSAGVDMEMVSRSYVTHGPDLVRRGIIPLAVVDEAVRRVLRVKLRAGLFDRPYADPDRERATIMKPEYRTAAREIAARSMVLLKNDKQTVPLSSELKRLAVIGPLADDRDSTLGNWTGDGRPEDAVTVLAGLRSAFSSAEVTHAKGVTLDAGVLTNPAASETADRSGITEAVSLARAADATVLVLGETGAMSGEATSRTSVDLPGRQIELARELIATGKPVAVVLMNGRPVSIPWLAANAPAILEAWFPGTEGGNAVADVLLGKVNPGGKLPVTFPRTVGQVPIYYNHKSTGRPPKDEDKYTSKYIDAPWTPLFPFGYGLSYTTFNVGDLVVTPGAIRRTGRVTVTVTVTNTGTRPGDEVVQLYLRDKVSSVTRPVAELKGFRRVTLAAGAHETVTFTLGAAEIGAFNRAMRWVVEPGTFEVRVGPNSAEGVSASFEVRP